MDRLAFLKTIARLHATIEVENITVARRLILADDTSTKSLCSMFCKASYQRFAKLETLGMYDRKAVTSATT